MSNLDWFRLWTMEHEKQGFGGPQGSDDERSLGGHQDGHDGGYHASDGMQSYFSGWGDEGYRPQSSTVGSGRSFGPDYHDDHQSGHFPFFGGGEQHNDGGGHGHGPSGGGLGEILGHSNDYDAILFGHLDAGGLHAGFGPGSLVVIPIEHLEINQNTLIQNTNILFDAHDGGSVQVGGDVTAISSQTGLIDHVPDVHPLPA